jgi:hypothetical protein
MSNMELFFMRTRNQINGPGREACIILIFALFIILPVVVSAEQNTDVMMTEQSAEFRQAQDQFDHFSHEGYDERHHCPIKVPKSYASVNNLTIDASLMNATPHWMLLSAGRTEQQDLLNFIRNSSVSRQKKTQLTYFLMTSWMKYPVKYVTTGEGAKLVPGRSQFNLNSRENATFTEIETAIADAMNQTAAAAVHSSDMTIHPMWAPDDHDSFTTLAATKENLPIKPIDLVKLTGSSAEEPDNWYEYPGGTQVHCLEHGYVPSGIPGMGIGFAPAKCDGFGRLAQAKFLLHDYSTAFTNLGYAAHFMQDLGQPYHTPQAQIIPLQYVDDPSYYKQANLYGVLINYQALHNAYEGFLNSYWSNTLGDGTTFKSVAESVTDPQPISDPKSAAQSLATQSWSVNPGLVYDCYWYWVGNGNYNFQNSPTIVAKTKTQVFLTERYTWGLVRYVTGGQPLHVTISASAGPGGRITPSGAITALYGDSPSFTIVPDSGYMIGDVTIDGILNGAITSYTFDPVTSDHTISATFKQQSLPAIVPLCQAGDAFDATKYPQNWPQSDPMTVTCNWDGNGRVYLSGDKSSLIGTYADDGFTVDTPNGIQFDAEGHYSHQHQPLELTSGMNKGSNTLTIIVRNWQRLSMSYGSKAGIGIDQTPYIIEVNTPATSRAAAEISATEELPSFITKTDNGLMINGTLITT